MEQPGTLTVRLARGVPMSGGAVFDMAAPRAVFLVHRGTRTDLRPRLSPCIARGALNEAMAWETTLALDQPGDHLLVAVPEPPWDADARVHVQQIATARVRLGPSGSDWATPLGLAAEIVPDPGASDLAPGGMLTGRVLAEGRPVPCAALEIECVQADALAGRGMPGGGWILATADQSGCFRVRLPHAGLWAVAARGVGAKQWHATRPLRQDAVLWVRVTNASSDCRGSSPARTPWVRRTTANHCD
nr:DUF4198 domain-containing protein [Cereibacter sediminicola]